MDFTKYFVIFALAMLVVACGQNTDDGVKAPDDNAAEPAQENAQEKAAAQETAAKTDDSSEFLKFISGKARVEYMVAYDLSNTYDGETTTGKMTQYIKTEKKIRTDFLAEGVESRMYLVNDEFTMCTNDDGWSCMKFDTPQDEQGVDIEEQETMIEDNPDDYNILSDGTKQVAGVTAKCYKVESKLEGENFFKTRYCVKDYVPLYIKTEAQDTSSEMIATKYSTSVSDSEFTPPAKAQDIGALMGGGAGNDPCAACNYLSGDQKAECLSNC